MHNLSLTPTAHVPTSSTPILVEPFPTDTLSDAPSLASVPSSIPLSQPSATKKLPERPKHVLEMEQRAKERKDKREQLKQAYEEKQRKADEERRLALAKMEEERRRKVQ